MMHSVFKELTNSIEFTDNLMVDIQLFLSANNCLHTFGHSIEVGKEARRLALLFGANPIMAETAAWLHDISAVIPNNERIALARQLQIEVLSEEEIFPMIIHQKISRIMAKEIFMISNIEILEAIGCHTTLRANSTLLDQVLFVADKISWDQSGDPPYIHELYKNLDKSIIHAAFSYINYLWDRKETLKVVHPWLQEAYEELKNCV